MIECDSTAELLRAAAIDFLSRRAGRARLRGWIGQPRPVDRALWKACADLGWTGVLLPESLGGLGLRLAEAALLAEEAGRHLFAEPFVAAAVMPVVLLAVAESGPSPQQTASLAQTLIDGERLVAVAWQEAAGQLDLDKPACVLADGRLSGCKRFVSGCDADAALLVWAQSDGEPVWVTVDASADGVRHTLAPAGLGTQFEFHFDQVRVADAPPLLRGTAARHALAHVLAAGRLAAAVELAGQAAGCLALTLEHLRTRRQFDRALGSFQAVQHRCVDLHFEVELARASCQQALASMIEHARPGVDVPLAVEAAVCAAKARAGEAAVRVGREAVQLHGAMGFCDEVDVGLYLRAALHGNAWLGGPTALRRRFAACLQAADSHEGEGAHV